MEVYIGGYAQGKLRYVLQTHSEERFKVLYGEQMGACVWDSEPKERIVVNHFHLWVKKLLAEGKNPEQETALWLEAHEDCIIISDAVGNGIVPMEAEEREYRERLGRIQTNLAQKAERVERILCGIGQRLK